MRKRHLKKSLICCLCALSGCFALYGWDIHAPGILSQEFSSDIPVSNQRMALYVPRDLKTAISTDKGNWHSDPQNYHLGEAFVPMLVEAFQHGFDEFILIETEPTPGILKQYGIQYLSVVDFKGFKNRKSLKGQGLDFYSETTLFNSDLNLIARFQTRGASEARAVFAKKGGPEVNLNAAIESNLRSTVTYLQDWLRTGGKA